MTQDPHSQWKYTGLPLGTIFLDGQPLVHVSEHGQLVNAADEAAAANLQRSGYFEQVETPAPVNEDADPIPFAAPIVPVTFAQPEDAPADPQEHE